MKNWNIIAATVIALSIGLVSFGASAKCPAFPDVSWWGELNHDGIKQYVKKNHDGKWGLYNAKWEKQLAFLKKTHNKGGGIKTPLGTVIKGGKLSNYINEVTQRLEVNECLAKEEENVDKTEVRIALDKQAARLDKQPVEARIGNPEAGKTKAQGAGCFECHTEAGRSNSPLVPNLAGQRPLYLVKQLMAYASSAEGMLPVGEKHYRYDSFMSKKALELSATDMEDIAAYFAGL